MAEVDAGIEVEALVRQFKAVRAVDGIDLRIRLADIYGFLRPNGAGKSTTVHVRRRCSRRRRDGRESPVTTSSGTARGCARRSAPP
jgi:ABC-type branched-subunit amino acid transport system ATPase component